MQRRNSFGVDTCSRREGKIRQGKEKAGWIGSQIPQMCSLEFRQNEFVEGQRPCHPSKAQIKFSNILAKGSFHVKASQKWKRRDVDFNGLGWKVRTVPQPLGFGTRRWREVSRVPWGLRLITSKCPIETASAITENEVRHQARSSVNRTSRKVRVVMMFINIPSDQEAQ